MAHERGDARLLLESPRLGPLAQRIGFGHLDDADFVQMDVAGLVDLAHSALADLFDDLVLAVERLPGGEPASPDNRRTGKTSRRRAGSRRTAGKASPLSAISDILGPTCLLRRPPRASPCRRVNASVRLRLGRVLRRLAIKNLAIVEDLEIEFRPGLAVLTGETGAGKSILVDAVLLLAGGRGSSDLVRHGSERLVVAGEFEVDEEVRAVLTEAGLPFGDAILIKRELTPEGRGRAFVEDEPAAIRTLVRLGERLVAVHGQNSEQELADRGTPLELLDAFAKAQTERDEVAAGSEEMERSPSGSGGSRSVSARPDSDGSRP